MKEGWWIHMSSLIDLKIYSNMLKKQLERYREIHETEDESDFDNPTGYEEQLFYLTLIR